jgi:hypothetical protein
VFYRHHTQTLLLYWNRIAILNNIFYTSVKDKTATYYVGHMYVECLMWATDASLFRWLKCDKNLSENISSALYLRQRTSAFFFVSKVVRFVWSLLFKNLKSVND